MKALTTLLGLGLASVLAAQSPLAVAATPFAATSSSNSAAGGCVFFDLTVNTTLTINRLDVNTNSAIGVQGEIKLYQTTGALTTYAASTVTATDWVLLGTAPATSAGTNADTIACFPTPITLNAGTKGYAVVYRGLSTLYNNGAPLIWSNADMTLNAGAAAGIGPFYPDGLPEEFATGVFFPRTWNGRIHYALGTTAPVCSYNQSVGLGCGGQFASWFDLITDPAVASATMNGKQVLFAPDNPTAPTTYTIIKGTGAIQGPFAPVVLNGTFTTTIVASPGPDDDGEVVVPLSGPFNFPGGTTSSVVVGTNGVVSVASNMAFFDTLAADDWGPLVPALLQAPSALWCSWHDYDASAATGGGTITSDTNPSGDLLITWNGVESYPAGAGNPSTMQIAVSPTSGVVTITWGTMASVGAGGNGDEHLIGWSPGGVSLRPDIEGDITLATPDFTVPVLFEGAALSLTSTPRPTFGSLIDYTAANIPTNYLVPVGLLYFSVANPVAPGFPLSFVGIGKPGCLLNFDLNNPIGPFTFVPIAAGSLFTIDTNTVVPSMLGLDFWGQLVVVDAAANLFDSLITSNALHQRVETL